MTKPKNIKKTPEVGKDAMKSGPLSDDEKRQIEQLVPFNTYSEIARKLCRNNSTIRKYCQNNGLSKDITSLRRQVEQKARSNHHLKILKDQLSPLEYDFAIQVYKSMNEQFGNDILYSEEVQIIEYCVVTCLLNRAITREMEIDNSIKEQRVTRSTLHKKKDDLAKKKPKTEDEQVENEDAQELLMDKMEEIDLRIAELQEEHRNVKKDQKDFFERKDKITKALAVSREQRAEEISRVNQNFGDFIMYIRKNQDFRVNIGLDIEKMRLAIKEEYIRLTEPFLYADGEEDYPIFNTEVASRDGRPDTVDPE